VGEGALFAGESRPTGTPGEPGKPLRLGLHTLDALSHADEPSLRMMKP